MKASFEEQQWDELCRQLAGCAKHLGEPTGQQQVFMGQAESFASQPPPQRYPDLLERVAQAASLASAWRGTRDQATEQGVEAQAAEPPISEAMVDETLDESFPASDPPAWTHSHA